VNIETAEEVKGRDFDVVGLIDAGKSQKVLSNLYKERETSKFVDVFGRTLADQYRVAASRSAEKLVLIDIEADYFSQVSQMGKSRVSLEIEKIDFDDLARELDGSFSIEQLVRSQIETIKEVINDRPERALLYLRTLTKQFETHQRESTVDSYLESEVTRIKACVVAVSLLSNLRSDQVTREQLAKEADRVVNQVANLDLFEVIFELAKNTASWSSDQTVDLMLGGAEILGRVEIELPEVDSAFRKKLTNWFDGIAKQDALADEKQTFRVLSDTAKFIDRLNKPFPYMAQQFEQIRLDWASQYLSRKKFDTAIKILEQLKNRDHSLEAKCYLEAGKPASASKSYELAGDIEQAIMCARQVPDIERALKLAKDVDSPLLKTLEWLNDARLLFENKSVRGAGQLTKQEGSALANWAAKSVAQTANKNEDDEEAF
jgi:tetratricopeptide (TPR) repeat protein